MDTPPQVPPPLPPHPRFNLSRGAWIAWAAYAVLNLALFLIRKSPADAYHIGELFGGTVGALILPTILALIVWRLSGRSAVAGSATFYVVFGFVMLGQLSQFARKSESSAAMNQLAKESQQLREEQRAALAQGRPIDDAKAVKLAERASANLAAEAANSSGNDRLVAEASKAFMDEVLAVKKRYDQAIVGIDADNFWSLAKFSTGAPAEARREAVRAYVKASTEMRELYDEDGSAMRRQFESRGASAQTIRDALAGYKKGAGTRLPLLRKIRDCESQLAQVMQEFIDFAEANREQWHVDATNGKIIFENQDLLDRYNGLIKRSNEISAEQTEYQKKMVAVPPAR